MIPSCAGVGDFSVQRPIHTQSQVTCSTSSTSGTSSASSTSSTSSTSTTSTTSATSSTSTSTTSSRTGATGSTTQEQIRICFGWKLKHASYKSNEPDLVQKLKHTTKERAAVKF